MRFRLFPSNPGNNNPCSLEDDGLCHGCEGEENGRAALGCYLESRIKVGTMPAAEEKPDLPAESQEEQPWTRPR